MKHSKHPVYGITTSLLLMISILFTASSCKKDADDTPAIDPNGAFTLLDVAYGPDREQKMDMYLPAQRTKNSTKVFVLVHGGGWNGGDKSDMTYLLNQFKTVYPNHAVININYRLAKNTPAFPMQIDDIQMALNKAQENAYQLSAQYFFLGASAGAHLSLLYGYAFDDKHYVKGVCNIVGPADLTDSAYSQNPAYSGFYKTLTGSGSYAENPELTRQVSPALRVTAASPKTISFYGNADPLVPASQMGRLHNALNSKGVYNEPTMYEGGHANWNPQQNADLFNKLIAFINKYFS